jgi:hypothetical protein
MVRFFQLFFSGFFNLINFLIFLLTPNYSYQDDKELCMRCFMDDDRGGAYTEANMSAISNVSTDNARLYIYTTARVFLPSLSRTTDFAS